VLQLPQIFQKMRRFLWTNSFFVRVPGLQLDDEVAIRRQGRRTLPKESLETLVKMFEVDPLYDLDDLSLYR
jgi:hypothetical protein